MIWSPECWEMGAVFVFAYLIMKFEYSLEYIWKLNERKIKNVMNM
jgi:low temperature requirement protein LtrA